MTIVEKFDAQPWSKQLVRRTANFRRMCEHVESSREESRFNYVIETGTARIKDNWAGDGQSTIIWDWLAHELAGLKCLSLDIMKENIENAKAQTELVSYMTGDSVFTLNMLPDSVLNCTRLLYLDSYDWSPELNLESSFHHMAELATVWRSLPSGCMVVVDDRHGNMLGKHWMVEQFFNYLKIEPDFKNHQIGWVKP